MTAPQGHGSVVRYISDGSMAFRGGHRAVVNGKGHQSRANAPGQRGVFFCVKCFVHSTRLKKICAKNQRLDKISTYYVSFVSFVSKSE